MCIIKIESDYYYPPPGLGCHHLARGCLLVHLVDLVVHVSE